MTRTSLAEREDELFFAIEPRCLLLHSATIASWNNLLLLPILEGGKVLGRDNKLLPRRGQSRAKGWKRSRKVDIVACWKLDNDWSLKIHNLKFLVILGPNECPDIERKW